MASLNTDVATELNITARRNDTFKMLLTVKDESGAILAMDQNRDSTIPIYQAKMTIATESGDEVLNLYSNVWGDVVIGSPGNTTNAIPTASTVGHYSGTSATNAGETVGTSAIFLKGQITASPNSGQVTVQAPFNYMAFQSGTYKYDFQIRNKAASDAIAVFTTWLTGTFTLNADITQA